MKTQINIELEKKDLFILSFKINQNKNYGNQYHNQHQHANRETKTQHENVKRKLKQMAARRQERFS